MGIDEMGSRRSGNKPNALPLDHRAYDFVATH